jgi:hypothetical protein
MKPVVFCLRFISCLALLAPGPAFNQTSTEEATKAAKTAEPVAYVYVSRSPASSGPNQVFGFLAHENGALTPIDGSPFEADVNFMVVNGKYLFGSTTDELYLDAYTIEPNGALKFAVANDISQITQGSDTAGYTVYLTLDHTGATLYDLRYNGDDAGNDYYEAFVIDKVTGALTMPPGFDAGAGDSDNSPGDFTFSANNEYMYGVYSGWAGYNIGMYDRAGNGALLNPPGTPIVSNPVDKVGYRFDPIGISADPWNHVAVAFANEECCEGPENGPNQLGVYTADDEGNLTTTSTYKNMPKVGVGNVNLKMAPSGELLAAFGDKGLQVFHFNGSEPITNYATLVQNVDFEQVYWDNNNHLYALTAAETYSTLAWSCDNATHVKITVTTTYTISGMGVGGRKVSVAATVTVNSKPAAREADLPSNGDSCPQVSITAIPTSITPFGGLFVYTVTPTTINEAPGSPYPIRGAQNLIVHPLK